jgi:hypothetical protein
MHPRNARKRHFWNLRHFAKMRRDTPRDLRKMLPNAASFVIPELVGFLATGLAALSPPSSSTTPKNPAIGDVFQITGEDVRML